jgi:hypothetical protein
MGCHLKPSKSGSEMRNVPVRYPELADRIYP